MLPRTRTKIGAAALAVAAVLGGCGDDGTGVEEITLADITRSFSAVTLTTTSDGTTTDQLAAGTTLDITLHEDGTTTGRLFVPGGDEDGGDLDANLAGTFTFDQNNDEVAFDQDADTFIRDMAFRASRTGDEVQLDGEEVFGETTVRVVLR